MRRTFPLLLGLASCLPSGTVDDKSGLPTDTDGSGNPYQPDSDLSDTAVETTFEVRIVDQPLELVAGDTSGLIRGKVISETWVAADYTATWRSDRDGELGPMTIDANGTFAWNPSALEAGHHKLTVTVTAPSGEAHEASIFLDVCSFEPTEHFDAGLPAGWRAYGNASWDPGGWLEVTGNAQSRAGSMYKTDRKVDPGDFRLEFRIATGGGINSGADGYTVNVVNVADVAALTSYVNSAANGGCLGYGISSACIAGSTLTVDAFHVEFDTWYNGEFSDPYSGNHVEITFDGHPELHPTGLAASVPTLEDLQWRDVVVQAQGTQLTVWINGSTVIDQNMPGFIFDGGYIGVSGSTGWASNYHRFDDLRILDRCEIPE